MSKHKTFAEIMAEARSAPKPAKVVRPGAFNGDGEFFDRSGVELVRIRDVTPKQAQELVAGGAQLAFEGCGCGGGGGCKPRWISDETSSALAITKPRFVKGYGSPTWIDLWEGENVQVVYAHGDVEWGNAFG